jgi:hypothetical protein
MAGFKPFPLSLKPSIVLKEAYRDEPKLSTLLRESHPKVSTLNGWRFGFPKLIAIRGWVPAYAPSRE